MNIKSKVIKEITKNEGTPFYLYDENGIIKTIKKLNSKFIWSKGFKNFYAVKACPNPEILRLIKKTGGGVDCSSMAELKMSYDVGFRGDEILFTSNNTPDEEFIYAHKIGATINIDDITHLETLRRLNLKPEFISFRYLPYSNDKNRQGNNIIGSPVESKFGITQKHIFEAYSKAKEMGVKKFGLHTMLASNELDESYFIETSKIIFSLASEISKELNINFEFINLGGGFGIPQEPNQKELDLDEISSGIYKNYVKHIKPNCVVEPYICFEHGRYITGPHGYLITSVRHVMEKHKNFIGIDACMANLMRPALYKAYHKITVEGDNQEYDIYDVVGSLCENSDKFAIDRKLKKVKRGDLLIIHDVGAHGYSMGFSYNGKLKCAEYMFDDNNIKKIRRKETLDDYFSTLNFD